MAQKYTTKARPGSGIIYIQFFDANGKYQRKSSDTTSLKEARKRAPDIMAGTFSATTPTQKLVAATKAKQDQITMARLFTRCQQVIWTEAKLRSQGTLRSNLKILNDLIGDELVTDMDYTRLENLADELRGMGYAESTVDRKISTVGRALSHACKEKDKDGKPWLAGKPPMPEFTADNFQERTISDEEEKAIFEAIAARAERQPNRDWKRYGMFWRFLLDTGCRLGEATNVINTRVTPQVVNGVQRVSVLFPKYSTKNKKPRTLWLTDEIIADLPYLRDSMGKDGKLYPFKGKAWYMWSNIRDDLAAKGIDVSDVKIHTARHTCLTRMAISGDWKIEEISRWAGHSQIQITIERYNHLLPAHSAHFVDRLNAAKSKKAN